MAVTLTPEERKERASASNARYYQRERERVLQRNKNWNAANPEKMRSIYMKYHRRDTVRALLKAARKRAKDKGIEFSLLPEHIIIPDVCPIMGVPFNFEGTALNKDYAPSIDRIDNTGGYTPDNIQILSWIANMMKRDASPEQLRMFAEGVLRNGGW